MKRSVILIVATLGAMLACGSANAAELRSQEVSIVVSKYLSLELGGARLSAAGLKSLKALSIAPIVDGVVVKSSVVGSWVILGTSLNGDSVKVRVRLNFFGRIEDFSYFTAEHDSRVMDIELKRQEGKWKVTTEFGSILDWRTVIEQRGPKWVDMRRAVFDAASRANPTGKKQSEAIVTLVRRSMDRIIKPVSSAAPTGESHFWDRWFSSESSEGQTLLVGRSDIANPVVSGTTATTLVYLDVVGEGRAGQWKTVSYREARIVSLKKEANQWRVDRIEGDELLFRKQPL